MWWKFIILCFVAVLIYLLFVSFFVEIHSDSKLFRIKFQQWLSATLTFHDESILVELKVFGWQKQIDLLNANRREKKTSVKKDKGRQKSIQYQKAIPLITSFRINKFFLTLDTGNMQLNGILYPLFGYLGKKSKKSIIINFLDDNRLILQMENKIAWILWAYIKATFSK